MRTLNDALPQDKFLWGSTTAAYQCEGGWDADGKGEGEWDFFSHKSPYNINGVDADVACDFYHKYREDIDLLAEGGQNTLRFSIAWSRIFPDGTGTINQGGVDYYNDVIDYCLEKGIEPNVTLFHYDLPTTLAAKGGWLNADMADLFCEYAKTCFELFGDRVKIWTTHNEPHYYAHCGYFVGNFPPNRHLDMTSYYQVLYNLMLGSAKAVAAFRDMGIDGTIGVIHDSGSVEISPDAVNPEIVFADADFFFNRMILCPALEGTLPPEFQTMMKRFGVILFRAADDTEIFAKGKVDFLGLNLYNRQYVTSWQGGPTDATNNRTKGNGVQAREGVVVKHLFETAFDDTVKRNRWGREVRPESMYNALIELKERYGNPTVMITENGHGAIEVLDEHGELIDDERIEALTAFIGQMLRAKSDGVNVCGYYVWSTMDLYSWVNGCAKRYGLVFIDYENDCKRIPKKSWYWYRDFIASHSA